MSDFRCYFQMPQNAERKRKKWNADSMKRAVIAVREKQMGFLKASKMYNGRLSLVTSADVIRLIKMNKDCFFCWFNIIYLKEFYVTV